MKRTISPLGAIAVTVSALTVGSFTPAVAQADETSVKFSSPSGNIHCVIDAYDEPTPTALCQIEEISYEVPVGVGRDENGGSCPHRTGSGNDFRLDQGQPGFIRCSFAALGGGVGPWPRLDYGQSRSFGAIRCDSAASGVTCTDTGTGHFFRVSRDHYELG
ncbi:hypothetical protein [Mycobacterium deserti]|uniref:Secreted protein n=1 Tax=Mycobacterium deserti TaxID=2978347 RepID=A0ABT2M404_9MYCO|nr:hypothetical protein [Mycobacterium deserti]MCT7656989.1 hypothetical protein [Mycobacterium deserti]